MRIPDSVFLNRPSYTCGQCGRWVFANRKMAKHWLQDKNERNTYRAIPHECNNGGFVTIKRSV
jgi:hypothetical protein